MSSFERIKTFLSEVKVETKKVTWPKPDELKESTTVVIVSVFLITVFIAIVDVLLNNAITFLIRIGT